MDELADPALREGGWVRVENGVLGKAHPGSLGLTHRRHDLCICASQRKPRG
ncbi:MAG TPA: hypothetical protein VFW95_11355 [Candidatus Limnocylindria bacterium]|nr:hypothetical protein [Candidatus Limnocylindria bacterium]